MAINEHGSLNKIKWVIVTQAALTGSGLNEILAGAEYKSQCVTIAKAFGWRLGRGTQIVKLDDLKKKEKDVS